MTSPHDIHRKAAARIFGVDESQVTPEQRNIGKVANFRFLYGRPSIPFPRSKPWWLPRIFYGRWLRWQERREALRIMERMTEALLELRLHDEEEKEDEA